ncbi:MAG TPA: hypothetical protein VHE35_17050 [Kofleriaceae bacterium]|nr:hypothetical protein [Kofleriaceae bacterium]
MSARSRQLGDSDATPVTPPIARVEILWSENAAVRPRTYRSLADADAALAAAFAAVPPPPGGAYDKTAFLVVWTDGARHEGRADVREVDVRAASVAGGIIRQHLLTVARWLRDQSGTAEWWTPAEQADHAAWGIDLLRRLDRESSPPVPMMLGEGENATPAARHPTADKRYRGATLLPSPPSRTAWLIGRFDHRARGTAADGGAYPRTTNKEMRWVANYVSRALVHDVPTFPEDAHARIWDHWRALHQSIELLLRKGGPHDEYTDNEGFWRTQLPSLVAVMISSWGPPRNRGAQLTYRPVGGAGDPYPSWVQDLRGRSGVYVIRERQDDGTAPIVYVGQSSQDRLYETLTRHFQMWRRRKGFWRGQYAEGHDPGLTYDRSACEAATIITAPTAALELEAQLIARLRPRDNLLGQPAVEDAPF